MYRLFIKRFLDLFLAITGMILVSPLFFILCLLVRIRLGSPIFFKQVRIGMNEVPFIMIKFRSMSDVRDENGNLLSDSERFTRFGDFLRKTSLDELPELINVLKGEMSIVGPRPLYVDYLPYYTSEESIRHKVRGGMTGLAQINGRALCKWNDRFSYDCEYVRSMSFGNDIRILWKTIFRVVSQDDIGVPSVQDEVPLNEAREVQRPEKVFEVERIHSIYK